MNIKLNAKYQKIHLRGFFGEFPFKRNQEMDGWNLIRIVIDVKFRKIAVSN